MVLWRTIGNKLFPQHAYHVMRKVLLVLALLLGTVSAAACDGGDAAVRFGTAETGVGIAAGVAVGLHGCDQAAAGWMKMVTGRDCDIFTSCGMQGLGVPRDAANIVDAGMSIVGMGGISAVEIACARNSSQLSRVTCVSTDYGMAVQSNSKAARIAAGKVKNGATVYKGGVLGVSETTKSQFLSLENPLSEGYAMRYGVPPKNAKFDFVLTGEVPAGCNFITRPAVPVGSNVGGAIEVVVPANAFKINPFYMP